MSFDKGRWRFFRAFDEETLVMPLTVAQHTAVFHSLEEQIVVIDQSGNILDVILPWKILVTKTTFLLDTNV